MVVKAKKIPELKIKESTPLSQAMANPVLRFVLAGSTALIITVALFIFMIYITDNFIDYSDNSSETLFTIQTIVLEDENQRPERVQKPAELIELMEGDIATEQADEPFENDTIPLEEWERMFPGQIVNEEQTDGVVEP